MEVRAVALGRWDLLAPEAWFVELGGSSEFPQAQGCDFAGETADGRRVLGFVAQPWMQVGALAERIAVPSALLAELPEALDWAAGSSLPVCALTARQLVDTAAVEGGDLVLVTGAAGMVGGFTVELAHSRGSAASRPSAHPRFTAGCAEHGHPVQSVRAERPDPRDDGRWACCRMEQRPASFTGEGG